MNINKIKEIIDLMNENQITEMEIEQEGMRVRISKKSGGSVEQVIAAPAPQAAPVKEVSTPAARPEENSRKYLESKAPMVGTFYRCPSPEAPPYVQIGDVIHKNDVLCIIEAMKLMNEVKSEFDGKVVNILVENAEAVEFGQTMFLIEPV